MTERDIPFLIEQMNDFLATTEINNTQRLTEESRLSIATKKAESEKDDEPLEVVFK